jgi:hypothetical protein
MKMNTYTVALLVDAKWVLRRFTAPDDVSAAYRFTTESVVYNEKGKAIHLVRRWQPRSLKKALADGATWETI